MRYLLFQLQSGDNDFEELAGAFRERVDTYCPAPLGEFLRLRRGGVARECRYVLAVLFVRGTPRHEAVARAFDAVARGAEREPRVRRYEGVTSEATLRADLAALVSG